jgi:hypothetical protein
MTHDEYAQRMQDGQVESHPLADLGIGADDSPHHPGYSLDDFLPLLVALLTPKTHLTTAPTFIPQNLLEAIQLYESGATRRLYVFVNGTWRYTALT